MGDLWGTAILTGAAATHELLLVRLERRDVWTIILTSLAIIAASLSWAMLGLP